MVDNISTSLNGGGVSGQPKSYVAGPSYQDGLNIGNGTALFGGVLQTSRFPTLTFRTLEAGEGIELAISDDGNSVVITANVAANDPIFYSPAGDVSVVTTNVAIEFGLVNTGVTAGTYVNPTMVVDAKGRVVSVANTVVETANTSINFASSDLIIAGTPVNNSNGSVTMNLGNTGVAPGTYSLATVRVDSKGRVTAISNGTVSGPNGTVTSVSLIGAANAISITGNTVTSAGGFIVDLTNTAVTPGTYVLSTVTVDAKGRIQAIANGSSTDVGVTSVAIMGSNSINVAGNPITSAGTIAIDLSNTGVAAGSYTNPVLTIDAKGRITAASTGASGVQTLTVNNSDFSINGANVAVSGTSSTATGGVVIGLTATGVTAGSYTSADITVDSKGRIRTISSGGSAGTVRSVSLTAGPGLHVNGNTITSTGTFALTLLPTGVSTGTYSKVTVDTYGRVTVGQNLSQSDIYNYLGYVPASTNAPVFAGFAKGSTATAGDNSTNFATTAFVQREISNSVNSTNLANCALLDLSNVPAGAFASKEFLVAQGGGPRALKAMFDDLGNVRDYKLSVESNYDNAFSRALAAHAAVWVPAGSYTVTAPIVLGANKKLIGQGRGITTILSSTASATIIDITNGASHFGIIGLKLAHSGSAIQGGDGISQAAGASCDNGVIEDVLLTNNYVGLNAAMATSTHLRQVYSIGNSSHGYNMVSTGDNSLAWSFLQCTASLNGGMGFRFETTGVNANGTAAGVLHNCVSFKNGSHGLYAVGVSSNALNGLRVEGGSWAEDMAHGIYLDTFGSFHILKPLTVDKSANCGIYITYNNAYTQIAPGEISKSGRDGVFNWGVNTQIMGGLYLGNGVLGENTRRNGISCYSEVGKKSSTQINGARCSDMGTGKQHYGITADDETMIVGCDLRNNMTGAFYGAPAVNLGNRTT